MHMNDTAILIFIAVLLAAVLILGIVLLMRQAKNAAGSGTESLRDELQSIRDSMNESTRTNAAFNSTLRTEITGSLNSGMKTQSEQLLTSSKLQTESLQNLTDRQTQSLRELSDRQNESLQKIIQENANQKEAIVRTLTESIEKLQKSNEEKLNEMQGVVDRKLDKTLNERLDTNFSKVTEQLGNLYKSLGELKDLSGGVADLNKTLSNVKTRGSWGEVQLGRILEQTMARNQYEMNIATKKNSSDRVEFAVKFPAADGSDGNVFLPIDAKLPSDIYNKIVDASEKGDPDATAAAVSELKNRIRDEAATISSKYLDPPRTTNYAFMYLPTEGLYSEVLRIDGLSEDCQKKGVVITGPTTITAVLNSLQVGFRNIALSRKSVEVMKLLEAVKAQVGRMNDAVEKTQKKLSDAVSMTDDLHNRTARLSSRMRTIGEMDEQESDRILELDSSSPVFEPDAEDSAYSDEN
jgi:DNA recombination protein RmuC